MLDRFTWFKQASYRWAGEGLTVYIDPWDVPQGHDPGDAIFITHAHFDHFSKEDIDRLSTEDTALVAPRDVAAELSGSVTAVAPGDSGEVKGVRYQAVPAYNVLEDRLGYHPKENDWVGYVLTWGDATIYHAGDTDHLPELESISVATAFLPIGGTFTMDPHQAAGLARAMAPGVAVPMHYGFVCGSPEDAETFKKEADPVRVEILDPVARWESDDPAKAGG